MNRILEKKKIYAIVISYNSAPVLEKTFDRIDKSLFDKIYFFDDNSPDGSAEKAKKFDWIVIKNEKNLGHGGNLKKGLLTACADGADYVVEIHADGQYPPNNIVKAKEMLSENYDLIIGSRFLNKSPYAEDGMPFMRYITNKFMSFMTRSILRIKFTEFHTGYKIFSKNFINSIPIQKNSDNYLFSFEVKLQAAFFKKKYGEISIASSYEGYHTSCNYLNGMIYLAGNFKIIFMFILAKFKIYKHPIFQD